MELIEKEKNQPGGLFSRPSLPARSQIGFGGAGRARNSVGAFFRTRRGRLRTLPGPIPSRTANILGNALSSSRAAKTTDALTSIGGKGGVVVLAAIVVGLWAAS